MKSIVLASGNPGKKAEIEQLLKPFGTRVVTQVELGITEAEEPYDTFLENALAKARHACLATRLPALADDSGLCVDALGGAPGVHSARYAGEAEIGYAQQPRSCWRKWRRTTTAARITSACWC